MDLVAIFIVGDNKQLLLKDNEPIFCKLLDSDKNYTDSIIREVKKYNLIIKSIDCLKWVIPYNYEDKTYNLHTYIAYVNHSDLYEWYDLDRFIDKINWSEDKELLKNKISNYL